MMHQGVIPDKGRTLGSKSGRYNANKTTLGNLEDRYLNEGFVTLSQGRKPPYTEITLAQWAAGQLKDPMPIGDLSL